MPSMSLCWCGCCRALPRQRPTPRVPGTFVLPRGEREDLWDLGRLSLSFPSLLPRPVMVVCFFMKGFHSVSVYKAGNKQQEPTDKKVRNHKTKISAGANWPRLSNFQTKSSLRETSVLSDSAHLGHPAPPRRNTVPITSKFQTLPQF